MLFKKKVMQERMGSVGENPYLNAKQEWLERYGSYISRASNWRMAAFLSLIIAMLSITGNVIQANQVKTIPYY